MLVLSGHGGGRMAGSLMGACEMGAGGERVR